MHFTISWDIQAEPELEKRIHNLLLDTLKKHAIFVAEPLSKYFIVKIDIEPKWHLILKMLKGICTMYKGKINFVMSPPMTGGQYNGELRDWTKVNETTKQ
ncbi:MAG: hypothetical protein N3E50_02560 [Candidatus Goldbacteria bacterium]|nr:hypothetical protein [Candidatus Goldiibacteriota bacterium]